ncbi:hypothetical protein M0R19_04185 [Candidatus Pacearchaeota archaeon]|jgi:hypothetical protein|nr:hypothetical protein [Candidatus Pacearchaeota archaeon]
MSNSIIKETLISPSTFETIDIAVYDWVDKSLNLFCTTNEGWKKVSVLWVAPERAFQIKNNKEIRDDEGSLIYPLITVERTGEKKDLTRKGTAWSALPEYNDEKGGSITIARRIKQDKTANFVNAETLRKRGQINFPRKSEKIVYETISIPLPIYVEVSYAIKITTEYQQQMNELQTPFITRTKGIDSLIISYDQHHYELFIDGEHSSENTVNNLGTEERKFKKTVNLRVLGHLIGHGDNQDKPRIVTRENAVEVKFPKEHVMLDDTNPFTGKKY